MPESGQSGDNRQAWLLRLLRAASLTAFWRTDLCTVMASLLAGLSMAARNESRPLKFFEVNPLGGPTAKGIGPLFTGSSRGESPMCLKSSVGLKASLRPFDYSAAPAPRCKSLGLRLTAIQEDWPTLAITRGGMTPSRRLGHRNVRSFVGAPRPDVSVEEPGQEHESPHSQTHRSETRREPPDR